MAYGYPYGYPPPGYPPPGPRPGAYRQDVWFPRHPPPDPPELPDGASAFPRWPAWYAPAAFGTGIVALFIAFVPITIFVESAGADLEDPSPGLNIALTVLQDLIFIGVAVLFASFTMKPKPWHFGLRRTRFWPAVGWASAAFAAFFLFQILYGLVFQPDNDQSVADDLGADESTVLLIAGAILVIVVAPVAEEFFFRGFFYRALRTRMGVAVAATVDGVLFGAIHLPGTTAIAIPILAVLGILFCLVYERTGTLFAPIALHALNNTLAFALITDDSVPVALAVGGATIAACMVIPRFIRGPAPAVRRA